MQLPAPCVGREVRRWELEATLGERDEAIALLDELGRVHGPHSTYGGRGSDGFAAATIGAISGAARSRVRVGRGRCVLRAPSRPIGLDGDAPGRGPRGDQFERDVRTGIGEQPCALADDDGIGEQVELVDQVVGEQPSDEGTAAGHQQFAVLLRLQITDGRGDVAGQDTSCPPTAGR